MRQVGALHDDLDLDEPTAIKEAILTSARVVLEWPEGDESWILIAYSGDGGVRYRGNMGEDSPTERYTADLVRYDAADGKTVLVGEWLDLEDGYSAGMIVKLAPVQTPPSSGLDAE